MSVFLRDSKKYTSKRIVEAIQEIHESHIASKTLLSGILAARVYRSFSEGMKRGQVKANFLSPSTPTPPGHTQTPNHWRPSECPSAYSSSQKQPDR